MDHWTGHLKGDNMCHFAGHLVGQQPRQLTGSLAGHQLGHQTGSSIVDVFFQVWKDPNCGRISYESNCPVNL